MESNDVYYFEYSLGFVVVMVGNLGPTLVQSWVQLKTARHGEKWMCRGRDDRLIAGVSIPSAIGDPPCRFADAR
ncbi:hypothetical protein TNCV_460161 [Trichonephila clavipes]|nr:hypothetical protein TNCV_460161 [Trichonephila clavipes]